MQQAEQRSQRLELKERRDRGENVVLYRSEVLLRFEFQNFRA